MTLWAVLDSRNAHGQPWIWTDSVTWTRSHAQDQILSFFWPNLPAQDDTRTERLRKARRLGLRAIKVRVEVIA